MSPKGIRHERIRGMLTLRMSRQTTEDIFVVSEPQFNLDDDTYLNPDILVHPAAIMTSDVRGGDALLVVEIADTSLRYDLNIKAPIYGLWRARILGHQCRYAHHDGAQEAGRKSLWGGI
jgi:hypothetical protein